MEPQTYETRDIPIEEIRIENDFNCRGGDLDIFDCTELAKNIAENGLISPITVTRITPANGKNYRLIAGFRRVVAHRINKATHIMAVIRDDLKDESEAMVFNLAENLNRRDLNILQEARVVAKLEASGMNRGMIAKKLGMSDGWVQVRSMLVNLPAEAQADAQKGLIKASDIRSLYTVYIHNGSEALFEQIRRIKDAHQRGTKPQKLKPKEIEIKVKKARTKPEIEEVLDWVVSLLGTSLASRALAWASGNISSGDFLEDMRKACNARNVPFRLPESMSE